MSASQSTAAHSKTYVERPPHAMQCEHNIWRCDCLPAAVLDDRACVFQHLFIRVSRGTRAISQTDSNLETYALEELLQDKPRLVVDRSRDTLDAPAPRHTPNGPFRDAANVVAQDLPAMGVSI